MSEYQQQRRTKYALIYVKNALPNCIAVILRILDVRVCSLRGSLVECSPCERELKWIAGTRELNPIVSSREANTMAASRDIFCKLSQGECLPKLLRSVGSRDSGELLLAAAKPGSLLRRQTHSGEMQFAAAKSDLLGRSQFAPAKPNSLQ
ncbi:hypothetical protein BT69DRAFT_1392856 [Atractiella rhizophila]|nr:hypothetical protein BT69DRAFT_1392856 [Atractiella rhizophila]